MNFWRDEPPLPNRISLISRRTWNGGNGEECRVVIECGRVGVWVAEGRTVRQVDYEQAVEVLRRGRGYGVVVGFKAGPEGDMAPETWDVAMGGCGCGSPLKSWEPSVTEVASAG